MKRGPNSTVRETGRNQGQKFKERPRPSGLYCPNCLLEVEVNKGDRLYAYFCENCMKVYAESRVLIFDKMVSVKFKRAKSK